MRGLRMMIQQTQCVQEKCHPNNKDCICQECSLNSIQAATETANAAVPLNRASAPVTGDQTLMADIPGGFVPTASNGPVLSVVDVAAPALEHCGNGKIRVRVLWQ